MSDQGNLLIAKDRHSWRRWLTENSRTATEVWLVYYRKHTGVPRIPYSDAVEEALCFGWIDSITKTLDEDRYSQRFTPRKAGSRYSQTNRERLRRLIEQGEVMPEVEAQVAKMLAEPFVVPADIEAALRDNARAWENFSRYPGPYRRIRIAYVDSARKRPAEFDKRMQNLIRKSEQDKQFGFGIEAFYQ